MRIVILYHWSDFHGLISLSPLSAAANEQILQSRPDRIRMTMFPEAIQEGEEVPSTQMMPNQQTNLQRLSQPAQILKSALSSLATYQVLLSKQHVLLSSLL